MITKFNSLLDKLGIKYCFNEQDYDFSKLKFIVVGDNPGDTEYLQKRFFIGSSGQKLRNHFIINGLVESFDDECIILNKTFISTKRTDDLENVKNTIGCDLFDQILISCAQTIAQLSNQYNIPILIFGSSKIGPNLLFDKFWKTLTDNIEKKSRVLVFKHPSYDHFFNEWDKYKKQLQSHSSLDLLTHIGALNTKLINDKYLLKMKARFFYGAACYSTWPKLFVLTEDGRFYSEYLSYNRPARVDLKKDFHDFKATDYKWSDYQSIVEIDEVTAKSKTLINQTNWISDYLSQL